MPSYMQFPPKPAKAQRWRATVKAKGFRQSKTFQKYEDAKTWATKLEGDLLGKAPQTPNNYTVNELIAVYKKLRAQAERPVEDGGHTYYLLRKMETAFGTRKAFSLTSLDFGKYVDARLKEADGKCKNALGNELSLLATVFKQAGEEFDFTPPQTLKNFLASKIRLGIVKTSTTHRDRRIVGDELDRLKEKLPTGQLRDIVSLAATLGFRRSEILGLQWKELDEKNKMIWVRNRKHPRIKGGVDNHVPLVFRSLKIIQRQPRTSEYIFPDLTRENVSDHFLKACRKCEIEDLHFHDLRHEAISRLFEAGLQVHEVPLISGHIDWRQLKRYTNIKPKSIHTTLEKLLKED